MSLFVVALHGFGLALIAPFTVARLGRTAGWLLALPPAAVTLFLASQLPRAAQGDPLAAAYAWAPALGLQLTFRADGLSLLFALLVSGVGTLVVIYAGSYLKGHPNLGRFYAWLFTFMAAMLGLALADNLLLLFVFWEITSLSSYMLIGFEHERHTVRAAAGQAFLVTGLGGLAMLGGLILLSQAAGTWELSTLLTTGAAQAVRASPLYLPALLLILAGAFTKSAQFPFHFWLPNAMEAPTPVSAYLHSATMVKAGVYLLARLSPALAGTEVWSALVGGVGAATMLLGGYLALGQVDLKRLLAYSTISALGLMTMLLGVGTPLAVEAAMVLLLAHASYKGALFLVAGILDHEAGTRDVTHLGGLFRNLRVTGLAAAIAAASMAGLPPLFGFISKEITYEAMLAAGPWLTAAVVAGSLGFVFVAGVVGVGPFWGPRNPLTPKAPHEAPLGLRLGPVVLAAVALAIGLLPQGTSELLVSPASAAVLGKAVSVKLSLWHGFNWALGLSVATLLAGGGLYAARAQVRALAARWTWRFGPAQLYHRALDALNILANRQTRLLQSGYLRYYLLTIVLTVVGLAGYTLIGRGGLHWPATAGDVRFYEVALGVLILLAALVAITSRSRLGAVAALGAAGYGVALIFLLFGAPDLAMTQFLVESLTVILFVLVFYHLPQFAQLSPRSSRLRDAVVALAAGAVMTTLLLSAAGIRLYDGIAGYFVANALPLAHGRNIVNVILVDFRGIDTLGEITVLGIAAVGVYALLKLRRDQQP